MFVRVAIIATFIIFGALLFFWKPHHSARITRDASQEAYDRHYEAKEKALEHMLGRMHDIVGHALIPFEAGGPVDMYYFPNGIPGTGFATMELIEPDGTGPRPNRIGTYELVAFTKLKIPSGEERKDKNNPFNRMDHHMNVVLSTIGRHSFDAVLNPGETCEVPEKDGKPAVCLIFDDYQPGGITFDIDGRKHCLLLCLEVFRSEMEYAMKHGSALVLQKLKEKGYYPYSDLDREPVF